MGLAIHKCLKKILRHLYISNMESTIEWSLYEHTTNKEDILSLIVLNQNFKDYTSIRDILIRTVSYSLEKTDYIYFARCMGCTLNVIKKFQLLKESLIQMIQDVREFLTENILVNQTKDEPMTPEERCIDYNKIMLYSCLTALSMVHNLNNSVISNIVSEIIQNDEYNEEEKSKFCVDLVLHNFMRPFHLSRVEEEQYYWNSLVDKTGAENVNQMLKFWVVFLNNLVTKDLKTKSYNDIVRK